MREHASKPRPAVPAPSGRARSRSRGESRRAAFPWDLHAVLQRTRRGRSLPFADGLPDAALPLSPPTRRSSCELDCWPVARRSRKSKPPGSGRKLQRAARAKAAPELAKVCRGTGIEAGNGESAPRDKVSAAAHLGWTAATEIGFDQLAPAEARSFQPTHASSLPTHCFD
jgi:hypothetical protein